MGGVAGQAGEHRGGMAKLVDKEAAPNGDPRRPTIGRCSWSTRKMVVARCSGGGRRSTSRGRAGCRCDAHRRQSRFGRWPDKAVHGEASGDVGVDAHWLAVKKEVASNGWATPSGGLRRRRRMRLSVA
jgi:hypothetical protein